MRVFWHYGNDKLEENCHEKKAQPNFLVLKYEPDGFSRDSRCQVCSVQT